MKEIDNKEIDLIFDNFLKDCADLVAIPSVIAQDDSNKPFGREIDNALNKVLEQAKAMGYETYADPESYYGYAEIGEGELFGVLCHIDVVPPGDLSKWQSNPFEMVVANGNIYGRGIQDDKGPTLLSMHALKTLLAKGNTLKKRVRFIYGCDEETLWRCMDRYTKTEEIPQMGFTPDSIFPVTNAEKGLYQLDLNTQENIDFTLSGGEAYNLVASFAEADYTKELEAKINELNFEYQKNEATLRVLGKAAHVKDATSGDNAIVKLAQCLKGINKKASLLDFLVNEGAKPDGSMLFGEMKDDVSGKLMFNIGKAEFKENMQSISIDMRIPISISRETIDKKLKEVSKKYDMKIKVVDYVAPLYVSEDNQLVQELMKAYQEVTNDYDARPLSSGGATYSRTMPNFVAFGADLPTSVTTAHQANEHVKIADYKEALKIYIKAFELLVF